MYQLSSTALTSIESLLDLLNVDDSQFNIKSQILVAKSILHSFLVNIQFINKNNNNCNYNQQQQQQQQIQQQQSVQKKLNVNNQSPILNSQPIFRNSPILIPTNQQQNNNGQFNGSYRSTPPTTSPSTSISPPQYFLENNPMYISSSSKQQQNPTTPTLGSLSRSFQNNLKSPKIRSKKVEPYPIPSSSCIQSTNSPLIYSQPTPTPNFSLSPSVQPIQIYSSTVPTPSLFVLDGGDNCCPLPTTSTPNQQHSLLVPTFSTTTPTTTTNTVPHRPTNLSISIPQQHQQQQQHHQQQTISSIHQSNFGPYFSVPTTPVQYYMVPSTTVSTPTCIQTPTIVIPPPFSLDSRISYDGTLSSSQLSSSQSSQSITTFFNLPMDWSTVKLNQFTFLGEIGSGSFGSARLCRHKGTGNFFCAKLLNRMRVTHVKQKEHILNEKTIMLSVNSPFIVKLFATFKTSQYLYFIMEYVGKGELFNYIRLEGPFEETIAKQIAAELVIALEYLHQQNIIYRDLKPENVLIDRTGHIKLADFGFAKRIDDKTMSMCGTIDYMSPEIMLGKGHGKAADWWSLGVLIYELLEGCPPFSLDTDNISSAANGMINSRKIEFPNTFNQNTKHLITKLLEWDPEKRLGGSLLDATEIKSHPWFAEINWEQVAKREGPGPFFNMNTFNTPSKSIIDSPFFDNEQHLEFPLSNTDINRNDSFDGFEGHI
eukprot:gene9310-11412_t